MTESDDAQKWPPDGWLSVEHLPAHQRYALGVHTILHSENNPDDTLQLALTHADLATIVFGAMLVHDIYPETRAYAQGIMRNLGEVTQAQHFLPTYESE